MTSPRLRLGPFELHVPVGEGGQGEVWFGRHVQADLPVAIKLMTGELRPSSASTRQLVNEVQQVARLGHPHVVTVLAHGVVPESLEGPWLPGTPFLVMEYVGGGSLRQRLKQGPLRWSEALPLLRTLLQALSHAHGRRVLHRDLKPENILLGAGEDLRPGVKLTDFGMAIADPGGYTPSAGPKGGTPAYMAPEQILGEPRDQGPWTDLYALGCVAWELLTGSPPFGARGRETMRQHLHASPPAFSPTHPVPEHAEAWLRALLLKPPHERPASSADVLHALDQLGPPTAAQGAQTLEGSGGGTWDPLATGGDGLFDLSMPAPLSMPPAPCPAAWPESAPSPPPRLSDAGLGLLELRQWTLVGRQAEQGALWRGLLEVHHERRPRVVLLSGAPGRGCTALMEGLAEQALVAGAAEVLWARHGPIEGPGMGLRGMLRAWLRCQGLRGADLKARLGPALERLDPALLSDLPTLAAWLEQEPGGPRGPAALRAMVHRLLSAAGRRRPLLLLLDDLHWEEQSVGLCDWLSSERPHDLPVLVVATTDEAGAAALRGRLGEGPHHVQPGALDGEALERLLRQHVHLDPQLSRALVERCAGNPLFALRILSARVARGELEPGPTGLRLKPGTPAHLPGELRDLWERRLEQLWVGCGDDARRGLYLGAVLGLHIDDREWRAGCALLGVTPPVGLLDDLAAAGLLHADAHGWRFVHPLLRETVEQQARDRGEVERLHRAAATLLRDLKPDALGRVARHLAAAGEWEAAQPLVLKATRRALSVGDAHGAEQLLTLARDGVDRGAGGQTELLSLEAWAARLLGDDARARERATAAAERAARHGEPGLRVEALRSRGMAEQRAGDWLAAEVFLKQAAAEAGAMEDRPQQARAELQLGVLFRLRRRAEAARAHLHQALALFTEAQDLHGLADVHLEIGSLLLSLGHAEASLGHLQRAQGLHSTLGIRANEAQCWNALGELHRRAGRTEAATEAYARAEQLLQGLIRTVAFPRINRALLLLGEGRDAEASPLLQSLRGSERVGELLRGVAALGLAVCAARVGNRPLLVERLEEARAWIPMDRHDPDIDTLIDELLHLTRDMALPEADRIAVSLRSVPRPLPQQAAPV